jgi:hypothetical protein
VVTNLNKLYVFDRQGQLLPGWPVINPTAMPAYRQVAIGDIDGDWRPDVVLVAGGMDALAVGSGDFRYTGGVVAYRADGRPIDLCPESAAYPLWKDGDGFWGRVSLADVNHDGRLDLVSTGIRDFAWDELRYYKNDDAIYVWELGTPYRPNTMQWPAFQHDAQRTGRYQSLPPTGVKKNWALYE